MVVWLWILVTVNERIDDEKKAGGWKDEREEKGKIQKKNEKIVLLNKALLQKAHQQQCGINFYTKTFVGHTNLLYIPKAKIK